MNLALEEIEMRAWQDLVAAAPVAQAERLGLSCCRWDDAFVLSCRGVSNLLVNRAFAVTRAAAIPVICEHFEAQGIQNFFVQLHPELLGTDLEATLERTGLRPYRRAWVHMLREDQPLPSASCSFEIRHARRSDADELASLYCDGFDLPHGMAPMLAALVERADWDVIIALRGARIVSVGFQYRHRGHAYLFGGTTAHDARGHGAQKALMIARIEAALRDGYQRISTETGEAAPGDPQHSYRNMLRCGFREIGTRLNYSMPGVQWNHGAISTETTST